MEALLMLALLTLGTGRRPVRDDEVRTIVRLEAFEVPAEAAAPSSPAPALAPRIEEQPPAEQPVPPAPLPRPSLQTPAPSLPEAEPLPAAPSLLPVPDERPPSTNIPRDTATPPSKPVFGPPDRGGSPALRDTERVGTAPNGEPLYAAAWYREPAANMLRNYLSTARGPGWGLIACRTAPDYRVEDCVGLEEYPHGSQITRSVLAAAWEFRVRPPRLGGRPQVGSWVRIRINYDVERR